MTELLPNMAICYNQMAVTLMGISQYLHIVNVCHSSVRVSLINEFLCCCCCWWWFFSLFFLLSKHPFSQFWGALCSWKWNYHSHHLRVCAFGSMFVVSLLSKDLLHCGGWVLQLQTMDCVARLLKNIPLFPESRISSSLAASWSVDTIIVAAKCWL